MMGTHFSLVLCLVNMPKENNPFCPTKPVYRGVFAGRMTEIERFEKLLAETKACNPTNILIVGERGIGKTSLLLLLCYIARGKVTISQTFDFTTLFIPLDKRTDIAQLSRKILTALERELKDSEACLQFVREAWGFIKRIEVAGSKFNKADAPEKSASEIFDDLKYSLIDTVEAITSDTALSKLNLRHKKDGLVIFLDEADNAPPGLDMGGFLKILSEQLILEDCNNVIFIVAGLPDVRDVLHDSHQSSLRLFEEMGLQG